MSEAITKILLVEDDPGMQKQLKWAFDDYQLLPATDRTEALNQLRRHEPPVVVLDLGLPPDAEGTDEGFKTLQEILACAPQTRVIVVTGNGDEQNGVRAMGMGACDFYQKPFNVDVLKLIVSRALHIHGLEQKLRQLREVQLNTPLDGIIATDELMQGVCRMVEKIAPTSATVLLLGESGTGKELLARALHARSLRGDKPFVAINCAAIPESLLESELFGHEKGAFTGAVKRTIGRVESANGGTLFLDEIGDMPLTLQAKLLRFLQGRVVERVGGREEIHVDVRVVCATNQDLHSMMTEKRFRPDLYHRISEVTIAVPPLRKRPGAATVLANYVLQQCEGARPGVKRGFTEGAVAAMENYPWPGNVRELENKVRSAAILAAGPIITAQELGIADGEGVGLAFNLREVRSRAERHAVQQALLLAEGNISRAAELLGITRPTLYDLMESVGLRKPAPGSAAES